MNVIDLRRTNLNLLIVFEVLIVERHVGRAAEKLGLTQSAVSHALGRLREAMNDPLFVRNPKGVEPTPHALEVAPRISAILESARSVLSSAPDFEPDRPHKFSIGATDGAVNAVLIPLMDHLRRVAPAVTVNVAPTNHDGLMGAIDRMEIDLAISVFAGVFERLSRRPILEVDFVGIARSEHSDVQATGMTVRQFAALPHLVISAQVQATEAIDSQLADHGLKRNVAMVEPHYLAAPMLVSRTDMIALVDRNLANMFVNSQSLMLFDPPIRPPSTTIDLLISRARAAEPPLRWLAQQIDAIFPGIGLSGGSNIENQPRRPAA